MIEIICQTCQKKFNVYPKYVRRGVRFCSLKCYGVELKESRKGDKNTFFGKKHTLEVRQKISERQKGEKAWNWKGGTSQIGTEFRHGMMQRIEYKLWRKAVFERDNYTCVWCGDKRGGNLEADHIKSYKDFPALRLSIDNGRTLCKACHKKTDTYGSKVHRNKNPNS